MPWINSNIDVNGVSFMGHRQGVIFTIPCSSALSLGDTFGADGKTYTVEAIDDLNQRGEVFIIDSKEVKNDKPKARRVSDGTRKSKLESKSDDGRAGSD
jgi:hypothetical protein